jgi:prefoldin subunit 5
MAELKMVIEIPELEALMADVQQVLEDVRSLKTDVGSRLDAIDNVIEELRSQVQAGQVNQDTVDQIASEVSSVRQSLASVDPEDPSGDDAAAAPPAT